MARLAKFTPEQIVETTARLAASGGPAQATVARIAGELGAPTGSIYHRFASRDLLLGEVWLRAAESFQSRYAEALNGPEPWEAGLAAALFVPARVRAEPDEARILLLHRREDFLAGDWPAEMAARALALKKLADGGVRDFAKRVLGRTDAEAVRTIAFATVDVPLAAILPHLRKNQSPPPIVDELIRASYEAVMAQAGAPRPAKRRR